MTATPTDTPEPVRAPTAEVLLGDARDPGMFDRVARALHASGATGIDCAVTSPPYWSATGGQREYTDGGAGAGEIGREADPREWAANVAAPFRLLAPLFRPWATAWINVGDARDRGRLVRLPHLLAGEMEAAGWELRDEVVWAKPDANPTDSRRGPIVSHESVLRFVRVPRYFTPESDDRGGPHWDPVDDKLESGQFTRTVWRFAVSRDRGMHNATFPPELPYRCVRLSTPPSRCAACGRATERIVERERVPTRPGADFKPDRIGARGKKANRDRSRHETRIAHRGWAPGCGCGAGATPTVVFDPFAGVGTTGVAAQALGRSFVGVELSEAFAQEARRRLADPDLALRAKVADRARMFPPPKSLPGASRRVGGAKTAGGGGAAS